MSPLAVKRFIVTGAPGSGKSAILRQLELDGYGVVEEAATDVIALEQARGVAEPWTDPRFIPDIVRLQRLRRRRASAGDDVQFHDRSAVCTLALAEFLGHPIPDVLTAELEAIRAERIFQARVLFVENLGFVAATEARRISFEDALRFERVHEEAYLRFGYELVRIQPDDVRARANAVLDAATR